MRPGAVQMPAKALLSAQTGGVHVVAVAAAAERDYAVDCVRVAQRRHSVFESVQNYCELLFPEAFSK